MNDELEKKIIRVYANWGIGKTSKMCKVTKEKVKEVLAKNGVEVRKNGWMWRDNIVSGFK
jgi:hypothetical protein